MVSGLEIVVDIFPDLFLYLIDCTHKAPAWDLPGSHVLMLYADLANWTANLRVYSVPGREGAAFRCVVVFVRFAQALQAIQYLIVQVRPLNDSCIL
jgi:hypothetical protein